MVVSGDAFERGYVDWLITEGDKAPDPQYTEAQNKNFAIYVAEARELKQLILNTKLVPRNLRKLKD